MRVSYCVFSGVVSSLSGIALRCIPEARGRVDVAEPDVVGWWCGSVDLAGMLRFGNLARWWGEEERGSKECGGGRQRTAREMVRREVVVFFISIPLLSKTALQSQPRVGPVRWGEWGGQGEGSAWGAVGCCDLFLVWLLLLWLF